MNYPFDGEEGATSAVTFPREREKYWRSMAIDVIASPNQRANYAIIMNVCFR